MSCDRSVVPRRRLEELAYFRDRESSPHGMAGGRIMEVEIDRTVRIFDSFEEADTADALSRSQMSPQERVDIFFAIQERAFPDASKQGFARVCRVLELEQR